MKNFITMLLFPKHTLLSHELMSFSKLQEFAKVCQFVAKAEQTSLIFNLAGACPLGLLLYIYLLFWFSYLSDKSNILHLLWLTMVEYFHVLLYPIVMLT